MREEIIQTAAKVAKTVVKMMAVATKTGVSAGHKNRVNSMGSKADRCSLKQPMVDYNAKDNFTELQNFKMEVNNIFLAHSYNLSGAEKVPRIKKMAMQEGPTFYKDSHKGRGRHM